MSHQSDCPKRIIALTAYNRPRLLEACLQSLAKAQNITDWEIRISVDPSERTEELERIILSAMSNGLRISHRVNTAKLGVRANPHSLLQWCFKDNAKLVLYLEDDIVVSSDCLVFCDAIGSLFDFSSEYLCGNLLTTTCNSHSVFCPPPGSGSELKDFVIKNKFFSSLGIILNQQQFLSHFEPNWFRSPLKLRGFQGQEADGWDLAINDYLLSRPDLYALQSLVPRITHKGIIGTHSNEDFHHSSYSHVMEYEPPIDELSATSQPLTIQVLSREEMTAIDSASWPYTKSFLNLAHHLTDLQSFCMSQESPEVRELKIALKDMEARLEEISSRLNKRSIRLAEKIALSIKSIIRR